MGKRRLSPKPFAFVPLPPSRGVLQRTHPGGSGSTCNFCGHQRPPGAQHPIQKVFICKTRCPASSPASTSKADLFPLLFPQASPDMFCMTSIDPASRHLPRDEGSPPPLVLPGGPRRGAGDACPTRIPGAAAAAAAGPNAGSGCWIEPSWSSRLAAPAAVCAAEQVGV